MPEQDDTQAEIDRIMFEQMKEEESNGLTEDAQQARDEINEEKEKVVDLEERMADADETRFKADERYRYIIPGDEPVEIVRTVAYLTELVGKLREIARHRIGVRGKVTAAAAARVTRDMRGAVAKHDEELARVMKVICKFDGKGIKFMPVTYLGVEVVLEQKNEDGEWVETWRDIADTPVD